MIHNIYERLQTPDLLVNRITYAISIFLMHKGCDPKTKNKDGKCVYDLMASDLPGLKVKFGWSNAWLFLIKF